MPLQGRAHVPGDKSIGHRSLMLGALCEGVVEVSGLGMGEDNHATQRILSQLGVRIDRDGSDARIHGVGLHGLKPPGEALDCGNSGTTMRLMLGILAGQPFEVMLCGDASLSKRPMKRVLDPLSTMGLEVISAQPGGLAPLTVRGKRPLKSLQYQSPMASAQVKSAVLFAGLWAEGNTEVIEPAQSRDHTERMLQWLGTPLKARPIQVPGDLSSAAFLMGAALLVPGSKVRIEGVGINPTRRGFLDVLKRFGARVQMHHENEANLEPFADIEVEWGPLTGCSVSGALSVRSIDELPLAATLASQAKGKTEIRDAAELRVKESDRIARTADMLRSFGVPVDEHPDGLTIHGDPQRALKPGHVNAHGDHRIAMCGYLLARIAPQGTQIEGGQSITSSFPSFHDTLASLSQ